MPLFQNLFPKSTSSPASLSDAGYVENATPMRGEEDINVDAYLDEELGVHRPKRKFNVKVIGALVAVGVVAVVVILAVTLSAKKADSAPSEESALSNETPAPAQFNAFWSCKNPAGDDWDASYCDEAKAPCTAGTTKQVKCCELSSTAGQCSEADITQCSASNAPSTCESGFDWFCENPEPSVNPVFTKAFCDSSVYPAPCSTDKVRSFLCCPRGVVCDGTKAVDGASCSAGNKPAKCDGSSATPTSSIASDSNSTTSAAPTSASTEAPKTESAQETSKPPSTEAPTEAPKTSPPKTASPPPPPPPPAPPAPAPHADGVGVTVYNNCGDTVFSSRHNGPVPGNCMNGNFCSDFNSGDFNLFVARGLWSNVGARTLVEIVASGGRWNYDISKIKGFNVGASIEYSGAHSVVCKDVNCPDAYNICEVGSNAFNPVYSAPVGKGLVVTFCPGGSNSQPSIGNPNFKAVSGAAPFFCSCSNKVFATSQNPGVGTTLC